MKLSEILAAEAAPPRVFGVEVDTLGDLLPPAGLKEIGVVMRDVGTGAPDDDLLDLVISYILAKVEVLLEVPAEVPVDAENLMKLMSSVKCSFSLLPPTDEGEEAFEAYVRRVAEFSALWAKSASFASFLIPVTSFWEYLIVEVFQPEAAKVFAPKDEYILARFASVMSVERSDRLKAGMRAVFEEIYGVEGFLEFRKALIAAVYDDAKTMLEGMAAQQAQMSRGDSAEGQPAIQDA